MIRTYTTKMSHTKLENYEEFLYSVEDILDHPLVQEMDKFTHHKNTTTLEHSKSVAYYNYILCKKFKLDAISAARGGMLHDFFLYDWHELDEDAHQHAFTHPKVALRNAEECFALNDKEREIIAMHMWPLAKGLPTHKETYCICLTDKYCALLEGSNTSETIQRRRYAKLEWALSTL